MKQCLASLLLITVGLCVTAGASAVAPQFVIPYVKTAPRIDGKIKSDEWSAAAGISGFVIKQQLDSRMMEMYACYDNDNLYLAYRLPYYPVGKKPKADWNRRDVFHPMGSNEDRIEILLDPHYGQHTVEKGHFMTFINAAGNVVYDQMWTVAEGVQIDWNVNARIKSQLNSDYWEVECAIPFAELGVKTVEDNARWFVQMSRYWSDFNEWTTLSPLASILNSHNAGATMIFSRNAPGYRIAFPQPKAKVQVSAEVFATTGQNVEFTAQLFADDKVVGSDRKAASGDASGKTKIDLTPTGMLKDKNLLKLALLANDITLYQAAIPFLKNPVLPRVTAELRQKKFIFMCRYLPYLKKAWIDLLDFSVLPEAKGADNALFRVIHNEREIFLKPIPLSATQAGNLEIMLPGVINDDGNYRFSLTLRQGERELASEFVDYEYLNFPFVGSKAGTSIDILPGFKPIERNGNVVSMISSSFSIGDDGLFTGISATQTEPTVGRKTESLLAAPVRLAGKINGKAVSLEGRGMNVVKETSSEIRFGATGTMGELEVEIKNVIEYDGLAWIDITLRSDKKHTIDSLTLEIPLHPERATLMHETSDKRLGFISGATARENGVIWDSMEQPNTAGTFGNFKPMIWVGNEDMGLTWCAESDRYWSLDERKPALELVRKKDQVVLLVHVVNKPLELTQPRTISFGIQPTPSKPLPESWRSWLVNAAPGLPNVKSFHYSAATSRTSETIPLHAWCNYNPYPTSYDEAKKIIDVYRNRGQIFLRYQLNDWIKDMLEVPEGRVYRGEWERVWMNSFTKSFQDFKAYNYDKYLKNVGFFTVYEDESYLRPMRDLALDAGYLRPDGKIQAEFGIRGLREILRRCATVWVENGMPNMYAVHKSGVTMTPCHSFAAISIDGEQRFMDNPDRDYIDNWPLDFIRAHVMGRQFGVVPVFLSEVRISAKDYGVEKVRKANRSMVALTLLHDIITWHAWNAHAPTREMVHRAKSDFNLGDATVSFNPYWAADEYAFCRTNNEQIKVSSWKRGEHLFMVVANLGEDAQGEITFIPGKIGFSPGKAVDYETQKPYAIDANVIRVPIPRHDFRIIFVGKSNVPIITGKAIAPEKINPDARKKPVVSQDVNRPKVKDDLLFFETFDGGLNATSILGEGAGRLRGDKRFIPGQIGKAVVIGGGGASAVEYPARANLFGPEGTVIVRVSPVDYQNKERAPKGVYHLFYLTSGNKANRWGIQIQRDTGIMKLILLSMKFEGRKNIYLGTEAVTSWNNGEWHQVAISWNGQEIVLYVDGMVADRKNLEAPYTEEDFADKIIKVGYETALPGKEQTAIDGLRIFCRKLTDREIREAYQSAKY